jgi:hypothetical protein
LSSVQAWKAATSWTWSISPFWSASSPNSRLRSAAMLAMARHFRDAGTGDGRSAPTSGACGREAPARLDYLIRDRPMQPRRLPQPASGIIFQIDHIIARHHKGRTATTNLALACVY